jgi:hypothetical protein
MKLLDIWFPLPGYKHYLISNTGRIINLQPNSSPHILDITEDESGNSIVHLDKEGNTHTCWVNFLFGEAFNLSWV